MKITSKTEHALRAMRVLGRRPAGSLTRSADIAEAAGAPEKYLEALLVDLRKAGLVDSRRGPEGGHQLAKAASAITVLAIMEAVDGPLVLVPSTRGANAAQDDAMEACLSDLFTDMSSAVRAVVARLSLEDLIQRAEAHMGFADFTI